MEKWCEEELGAGTRAQKREMVEAAEGGGGIKSESLLGCRDEGKGRRVDSGRLTHRGHSGWGGGLGEGGELPMLRVSITLSTSGQEQPIDM